MDQTGEQAARYGRLTDYLSADPTNLRLIAEAADTAYLAGLPDEAAALVERHAAIAPPPPSLINLLGLCALAEGRDADAVRIFTSLVADQASDPGLRFNLAWAQSRAGDPAGVLETLASGPGDPREAALMARALHALERLPEALALGDAWDGVSEDPDLWSALATAALDAEDLERAMRWAPRAADTSEGQAALGMLALAQDRNDEARGFFDQALSLRSDSARGRLGLAALLLSDHEPAGAAEQFDRAAETFEDHLGSWIAAGWSWFLAGDAAKARARFERVIALDDTFSEAHGGLALLDFQEGLTEEARRRADIALRLDRHSLGGQLVRSLLLDQAGDARAAAEIVQRAMNARIGPDGQSIAQRLAARAARGL